MEFKKTHGDKYDYSKFEIQDDFYGIIICKVHGEFSQKAHSHMNGCGCNKCAINRKYSQEELLKVFKEQHGDRYDYSKVVLKNISEEVVIICEKHGEFMQKPAYHIGGSGCQMCNSSKGENVVFKFLKENNIDYVRQKYFKECFNPETNRVLKFDFYLPKYNLLIEYDGKQHFEPIKCFGGEEELKKTKIKDKIKNEYARNNKIPLLRINHEEHGLIEEILNDILFQPRQSSHSFKTI